MDREKTNGTGKGEETVASYRIEFAFLDAPDTHYIVDIEDMVSEEEALYEVSFPFVARRLGMDKGKDVTMDELKEELSKFIVISIESPIPFYKPGTGDFNG